MVLKNTFKFSKRNDITFEGEKFSVGANEVSCTLTTDSLSQKGSPPKAGQCTIVERFNSRWDVKDLIDVKEVQKALSKKSTLAALASASSVDKILDLLALSEIRMLADYSEFQAQTFKKGHILSQSLGGPGTNQNLTPMSASANAIYRNSFEAKLIKLLEAIKKEEQQSGYCVRIKFYAKCVGNKKPWWNGQATEETKRMLRGLPKSIDANWRFDSFFRKGKTSERIAKSALPPSVAKKMPVATKIKPPNFSLDL